MPLDLSRRAMLGAVPALAVPVTLLAPLPARAAPLVASDPLPGLLADVHRCRTAWNAVNDADDTPEERAAWAAFMAAEKAVETTVATSPEGIAAQIEYIKGSYVGSHYGEPLDRADALPVAFLNVILEGLGRIGQ